MKRILVIPLALLALLALAIVWSGGGKPQPRREFVFINRGDIYTLDLNHMSYMQDFRLTYGIREGLYGVDPETLHPIPAEAIGSEVSDDKLIWTFHLRPGMVWSNGDPITARDYVFSWRRMLDEPGDYTYLFNYIQHAEDYSKRLQDYFTYADRIKEYEKDPAKYVASLDNYPAAVTKFEETHPPGSPEYTIKRAALDAQLVKDLKPKPIDEPPSFDEVGIKAVDALTFRVTLANPVPFMLELAAFPPFYPRNEKSMEPFKEIVNSATGQYTYRGDYTRPAPREGQPGVVTNGPYILDRWDFKQRLVLMKSPTYWDRANVRTNSIEMSVNDNALSQFLQYEAGSVDWLADVSPELAPELRARGRTDLHSSPAFGTQFLTMMIRPKFPKTILDGGKNPLADVRVRQAMAMSIDKKFLVENVTRMGEIPARTFLPPDGTLPDFRWTSGPYDSQKRIYDDKEMRSLLLSADGIFQPAGPGLPTDFKRARELLADAGYPNGKDFPTLPIHFNTNSPALGKMVQALKNQWKQNLNIDVVIVGLEGQAFKELVNKKEYAMAPAGWFGDYPDITTFTDKYIGGNLQNDSDYRNATYDALCARAQAERDAAKRVKLLSQAENLLDTEVPIIPLYHFVNVGLYKSYVHGVAPNPRGVMIFKGVGIDPH